jgi:fermentation-respiration switch protein FrsA (DUF1100 family)
MSATVLMKRNLFIVGAKDQHTTLAESQQLFNAAGEPKELWVAPDAGHVDIHAAAKADYEQQVLNFFGKYLSRQ